MSRLFDKAKVHFYCKLIVRFRHKDHWLEVKKKQVPKQKALEHFNSLYHSVYGNAWHRARVALLQEGYKYVALLNNFSDVERTISELQLLGAINLKSIYDVYEEECKENPARKRGSRKKKNREAKKLENIMSAAQHSVAESIYPSDYDAVPDTLSNEGETLKKTKKPLSQVQLHSIEDNVETFEESDRIVNVMAGVSSASLYEYIPATRLKGLEDWVLESKHFGYYQEGADFSPVVEEEAFINFPEHLKVYTFEESNDSAFPLPKIGSTKVYDYYLMEGSSILPVLALDLQLDDSVIDMCAGPGSKSLAILQTLCPKIIVMNEVDKTKRKRITNVLEKYVADMDNWCEKMVVTEEDPSTIVDKDIYNKILVDVPCTCDRHSLHSEGDNLFHSRRIQERLQLPETQAAILTNALKLVTVGGTVVYTTNTLSPVQNDGVVQLSLKKAWEEEKVVMVVKDISRALAPLSCLFQFAKYGARYGSAVLPTVENNWGPVYVCKLVRMQ